MQPKHVGKGPNGLSPRTLDNKLNPDHAPKVKRRFARKLLVRFPRALPLALFALILAITALSTFAIERGEGQRRQAQLREQAGLIASALERRASANSSYLRAGAALFATLDDVSLDRFRRFVGELRLDSDYRGAEGVGWAPRVLPDERAAWRARYGDSLPGDRVITPGLQPGQPFSTPVSYLQPDTERNRRALGYDMYSEVTRRAAMDRALAEARPVATGRLTLLQDGAEAEPGFIIYMPVFRGTSAGADLKGFIYSPFNASDFLSSALELESIGQVGLRLYDGREGSQSLLAQFGEITADEGIVTESVTVAQREWILEVAYADSGGLSNLSLLTLLFGLMVASLLMMVVRLLTQQAIEDNAALLWFEEQSSIRNSLTRELNHRVKNTLANVLSIVALTRRRASSLDDFADGLDGRIRALSATHDLLTSSEWGTTPIRAVVETELAPYAQGGQTTLELEGPEVELAPNDALSMGLAIHELATNAAKYGALSQPGGTISVKWRLLSDRLARVAWCESGGPPVAQERNRGFGTELIEKIVAHELRNPVDLRFEPAGVECELTIPVRRPVVFALRSEQDDMAKPRQTAQTGS